MYPSIQINTNSMIRAYHLVPRNLEHELKDAFQHISLKFLKEWRKTRLSGPPGIKARPRGIFTRFQKRMLFNEGLGDLDNMGMEIYTESKLAQLHETGGTLKDPSGGKLAVPLSARSEMYTTSGALRKRYKLISALRNIFPKKINGKIFLVRAKKKDHSITPLYVLKSSVRIKPRLKFYETFEAMKPAFYKILNSAFDKALVKSWRY